MPSRAIEFSATGHQIQPSPTSGEKKTQCYSHTTWTNEWGPDSRHDRERRC